MRSGQPIEHLLLRQRKRLARDVIHEGGNVTDYAKEAGISLPAASRYLSKIAPCLLAALKDNSKTMGRSAYTCGRCLCRLPICARRICGTRCRWRPYEGEANERSALYGLH